MLPSWLLIISMWEVIFIDRFSCFVLNHVAEYFIMRSISFIRVLSIARNKECDLNEV